MTEFLNSYWLNGLGWTLIHSLWQSAIVLILITLCFRLIPGRFSQVRYGIACAGMLIVFIAAVSTFLHLGVPTIDRGEPFLAGASPSARVNIPDEKSQWNFTVIAADITSGIEENMPWMVTLWAAGFLFFSARFATAFFYTTNLRSAATLVDNEWATFVTDAAKRLRIRRIVSLCEAASISSPVVIGYFKPVILVPVGMFTGLTPEQLETIFLHELAHIRRHDYLVNLGQSAIETIFFFNPFVWIVSNMIRTEREYCCDDMVVRYHGSSRAYAHALATLAEARLSVPGVALSLGHDKNQLLNRIKRIMERSVKNSRKTRFVLPAILLLAALMCISWLGMDDESRAIGYTNPLSAADTVPGKKGTATYSRKSIITIDKEGRPHEEVVEEFEGDESLRPLFEKQFDAVPGFPSMPGFGSNDTIPPFFGLPGNGDWDALTESLQENLRKNMEMLEEFRSDSLFINGFADRWESFRIPDDALKALEQFRNENVFKHMEEELKRFREFDSFRDFENEFAPFGRLGGYEEALRNKLLEDGYLKDGESIESLEWSNDSFKVNGKTLRKEDQEKYRQLNREFFHQDTQRGGKLE